ncbi:MAG TPA: hypothetical protein VG603_15680 [Chitinophagales bacterium]|nr:hypothetical protein [Chitinophagales bacterium]
MGRLFILFMAVMLASGAVMAQDDALPPPSSHPQQEAPQLPGLPNKSALGKKPKIDLSDYIIEPNFDFGMFQSGINVGFSPYVGHRVWKNFFAGAGVTYLYTGFKNIGYTDFNGEVHRTNAYWHTFGGGVFAQYNVWRGLFVRANFEVLHRIMDDVYNPTLNYNNQTNSYTVSIPRVERTIPNLMLGVGYNLLEVRNFFFPVMISYNVLNSLNSRQFAVYPNGWCVQLGFIRVF